VAIAALHEKRDDQEISIAGLSPTFPGKEGEPTLQRGGAVADRAPKGSDPDGLLPRGEFALEFIDESPGDPRPNLIAVSTDQIVFDRSQDVSVGLLPLQAPIRDLSGDVTDLLEDPADDLATPDGVVVEDHRRDASGDDFPELSIRRHAFPLFSDILPGVVAEKAINAGFMNSRDASIPPDAARTVRPAESFEIEASFAIR